MDSRRWLGQALAFERPPGPRGHRGALQDAGTVYEAGWVATDDGNIAATNANLGCNAPYQTWTNTPSTQEDLPINCVNWFESYAFCIWDGGFWRAKPSGSMPPLGAASSASIPGARRIRGLPISTRSTTVIAVGVVTPGCARGSGTSRRWGQRP
jgi:hypothetical protein